MNVVSCVNEQKISGEYNVTDGIITVIDIVYGDVNGGKIVDDFDHLRLMQWLNDWPVEIMPDADANGDGKADVMGVAFDGTIGTV